MIMINAKKVLLPLIMFSCAAIANNNENGNSGGSDNSGCGTVTGFNAGIDVGASYLKNKLSRKKTDTTTTTKDKEKDDDNSYSHDKTKTGFGGDLFIGYNKQLGVVVLGAIASFDFQYKANPRTSLKHRDEEGVVEKTSVQRKYAGGIKLRAGIVPTAGWSIYANFGTIAGKYLIDQAMYKDGTKQEDTSTSTKKDKDTEDDNKNETKTDIKPSFVAGVDVEKDFCSSLFVRLGVDKVFERKVEEKDKTKIKTNEWRGKIGIGCRF